MSRIFPILWCLFCSVFAGFGIYMAASQHQRITRFQPVEVTVLETEVETRDTRSRNGSGVSYLPVVHYRYEFGGETYEAKSVFPMDVGRGGRWGREWATSVVQQFRPKQTIAAYYDPANPAQAFLLKRASVFPYFFILLPSILGIVGLAAFSGSKVPLSESDKRRRGFWATSAWHGIGILAAGHYFLLAGEGYERLAVPVFGGYFFLGIAPLLFVLPAKGIGGRFKSAGVGALIGGFLGFWLGLCSG